MKFANKMHCLNDKSLSVTKATIKIEPIDCEIAINHITEDDYHHQNNRHHPQQQQQQQQQQLLQQQEDIHHPPEHKIITHQSDHNNHIVNRNHNHNHHNQQQHSHHNNQQHQSQQQQQQQKVILSPRMEYYHHRSPTNNNNSNKHNSVTVHDYQQIDDTSSSSMIDSSRTRCRSPLVNDMPSSNPQIVITRAVPHQQQQHQQSVKSSTSQHSPSSSNTQHLQQVRVIRDGRLYEESRRRSISSESPTTTTPPPQQQQHTPSSTAIHHNNHHQQQQHNHHHNLPASENNLRILSVAAVAAAEEQAAAAAAAAAALAARKHSSSNSSSGGGSNISSRHVNVISTNNNNNNNSGQKIQSDSYNNNNNNNSYINSSSGCTNSVKTVPSSNCTNVGNNASVFRTPVVSSSSNSNNNNNNSMRPPPPPPPPKIKNSTNVTASSSAATSSSSSNQPSSTSMLNNNSEEPSSSIPDLEFDGTTVLCRVCGDKASGFHYGVHSCEGCKGFFRRSIQQKIQYRPCTKNQQCSILRINRNRCQYCRLKKCIAVGMSRDAVRFGRVPKREKARILAAMQQSTQNRGQQRQLATELDDQPRLLSAVLRAHMETCEFTKEKVTAMRQRARECPSYSMPTLLACPLNPAPELQSEQEFSERFAHVIRGVIDFAGMIPGFQLLNQDDKFTLLKAGLFDALFVRLICMFDSSINSIICLNGQVMRRDAIQNGANARFLVDSTFNFAERMNSMNLTDAEIGLFCAIVLITPDRPGLRNIELIDKMYSRLKSCLQSIINQNRPDQPDFMSELLKTMPDLRTLSTLHTEKLVVFRTEHKELLRQQMWQMDDDQPSKSPGSSNIWDDRDRLIMDDVAKSPLGSVSSTESGDIEYSHHHHHHNHTTHHHNNQPTQGSTTSSSSTSSASSLASSAPLLAATLSGTCPLRNRANSGSSAEDVDIVVGSHAHLTQNGLTITPVARSSQLLHHHLNGQRHPYRKLDSPTDSGIESGNEKAESTKTVSSGGGSSCSSPRSCVDDAMDAEATPIQQNNGNNNHNNQIQQIVVNHQPNLTSTNIINGNNGATKRQIVEDMPVLKRVLQAPPLYDTNSLMDEAYKPHKKFRALRHRDYDAAEADATTTTTSSSSITPPSQSPVMGNSSNNNCSSQINIPQVQQQQHHHHHHNHQQSQLHMHLTRNTNTTTTTNNNNNNTNYHNHHNNSQSHQQQQQQHSSLSSTHSVLAKSLMGEPRMTPEQMKRSDIIQNYIMRDQPSQQVNSSSSSSNNNCNRDNSNNNGLLVCAAASSNSSPCPYSPSNIIIPASSTNNSNCSSPSTTTVTLSSPPPPQQSSTSSSSPSPVQVPHSMRWQGHSVITTTTLRQQSISPHSNSSTTSCNSNTSNNNNNNNSNNNSNSNMSSNYFQTPHSTSVSPPRPSPSAHSPHLLELQVDIADSQQPLNLSKKSPTPPPSTQQQQSSVVIGSQKLLSSSLVAHNKYPIIVPDVTVTPTNGTSSSSSSSIIASSVVTAAVTPTVVGTTIHKVLLEA